MRSDFVFGTLTVNALTALYLTSTAHGHGAQIFPITRNYAHPEGVFSGASGIGVCGSGPGSQWIAEDLGASFLLSPYGSPLTVIKSGGRLQIEVVVHTPLGGHFVLELCPLPHPVIKEDCFVRLERDEVDQRHSPYVHAAPSSFFMPVNRCAEGTLTSLTSLKAIYKIPPGLVSEHAILRWTWQSGEVCDSSPFNSVFENYSAKLGATSVKNWIGTINLAACESKLGTAGVPCGLDCPNPTCTGRQFKNCADVKIEPASVEELVTSANAVIQPALPPPPEDLTTTAPAPTTDPTTIQTLATTASESTGTTEPGAPTEMQKCLSSVKGVDTDHDQYCRDQCDLYLTPGKVGHAWCESAQLTHNLTECLLQQQTACQLQQ